MSKEIDLKDRDFFRERLSADEIRSLLGDRPASDLFSARSPSIAKRGIDAASVSEQEMVDWMAKEPRLIRRPFMQVDGMLVVQPKVEELDSLLEKT